MIYGAYEHDCKRYANIYYCWRDFHMDTFSPSANILHVIEFKSHGKTYEERKESVRNIAIDFQHADSDVSGGLGWYEMSEVQDWFKTMAKRYGLVEEFEINAII